MKAVIYPRFLEELLNSCPQAGDGVHPWLFRVARYLHHYHAPDEILTILEQKVANCGRSVEPHEIPDAIKNSGAYQWTPKSASQRRTEWLANPIGYSKRIPDFDPAAACAVAARIPFAITPDWLKAHSPGSVQCSTADFLSAIFQPGEKLVVFTNYRTQGHLYPDEVSLDQFTQVKFIQGAWFLCNPVDGRYHWNPRLNKASRRSEESVTAFRHAVLECDHQPRDRWRPVWLAILAGLNLPITAITDSGGKSDHAIVRVAADSKSAWDKFKHERLRPLVKLGADEGALSAVRLTRLPGCWRNGQRQELLYLNPSADGTPIFCAL